MATTKLKLYNGALRVLGQQELTDLTENVPRRYYLDEAYDDDFVDYLLEQADWIFAIRTSKLTYDASYSPGFGETRVHGKPDDFIRLVSLSTNEYFEPPMTGDQYRAENDLFYSDYDDIYMRYVSNDASYGNNLSKWTTNFNKYAQAELAAQSGLKITNSSRKTKRG